MHVDQRALVDHVVEAAAGIPAVVVRLAVKSGKIALVAKTGDLRASRCLEFGRSIATRRKDHEPIPGVAQSRAHREQVGDLVLEEGVGGNPRRRNNPARAPTLAEASAEGRFDAQNPGAPLPLRAGVEAEDALAGAGREVIPTSRSDSAELQRIGESLIDVGPGRTGVEADIGAGPIIVDHRRRRRREPHVRCHCAGPASIAASPTLPSKNFFIARPPKVPR